MKKLMCTRSKKRSKIDTAGISGHFMTKNFSNTLGDLGLPANFPTLQFDAVSEKMSRHSKNPSSNWFMFAAAWNATGYRLIATHRSSTKFDELLNSSPASIELRFLQDDEMFSFFSAALSAIECAFFAAYACVSQIFPADYPINLDKDLRITPERIIEKLKKKLSGTSLGNQMINTHNDTKYTELSNFRNYLSHRGTLPRQQYAAVGPAAVDRPSTVSGNPTQIASKWIYDFEILPGCLIPFVDFADIAVGTIIHRLDEFINSCEI